MLERLGYILITDPQAEYLYVHASDLPRLRDVLEYRFFRGEEYAFVLLAWFQANGALSAPEAEALRASAASFREQSPILRHR